MIKVISVIDVRQYKIQLSQDGLDDFHRDCGKFNSQFDTSVLKVTDFTTKSFTPDFGYFYEVVYTVGLGYVEQWESEYM